MKRILYILLVLTISLFVLTGCKNEEKAENLLDSKINSELDYIEDVIFKIIKCYLLEDYRNDDGTINWEDIKNDFTPINQTSNVMVADFSSKNFSNDDILKMEDLINNVNLAMIEENEVALLISLANFYTIVPEYMEKYIGYEAGISIKKIKSINLFSYVSCVNGDFDAAKQLIAQAENEYYTLSQNSSFVNEKGFVLNKLYIVIQEYKIVLDENNLDLARIKYLNTLSI